MNTQKKEKYIGIFEIEHDNGTDYSVWEVVQRGRTIVIGTGCNVGLLETYRMEMEEGETLDEALAEALEDLEVEARDGEKYMSRLHS